MPGNHGESGGQIPAPRLAAVCECPRLRSPAQGLPPNTGPRGHLNVIGLTLLGSLGEELRGHDVDFLRTHPAIDALCFWSIARRDLLACECVTQPGSGFVHELLRPAGEEDRWRSPFIIHTTKPDGIANYPSQPGFHPWQGLFDPRGPTWCAHWRNVMRTWLFAGA